MWAAYTVCVQCRRVRVDYPTFCTLAIMASTITLPTPAQIDNTNRTQYPRTPITIVTSLPTNSVLYVIKYFNLLYYALFQMRTLRENVLTYRFFNVPLYENALLYSYNRPYGKRIRGYLYFAGLLFLRLFKYNYF